MGTKTISRLDLITCEKPWKPLIPEEHRNKYSPTHISLKGNRVLIRMSRVWVRGGVMYGVLPMYYSLTHIEESDRMV